MSTDSLAMAGSALKGIRVMDMTQGESGPMCTMLLAMLGAEVIKSERPPIGDYNRQGGLLLDGSSDKSDISESFLMLNTGKKSISLNLKKPEDLATFKKLLTKVDVYVENMGPGAQERMGCDWESLHKLNPRLIFARIKGQNAKSPWYSFKAYDPIGVSTGGLMTFIRQKDGKPIRSAVNVSDSTSGHVLAEAILAALVERERTGEGREVQVSMQEAALNLTRSAYAGYAANSDSREKPSPADVYACAGGGPDDWCYVEALNDAQWKALTEVIGRPELAEDPKFATTPARQANRAEVDAAISAFTIGYDKYEVMDRFIRAGVPAGAVMNCVETLEREKASGKETFLQDVVRVEGKPPCGIWSFPVSMSKSPIRLQPAPHYGQHTQEVMQELLGEEA